MKTQRIFLRILTKQLQADPAFSSGMSHIMLELKCRCGTKNESKVPDVFVTKASVTPLGESESFIYITDGEPRLVFSVILNSRLVIPIERLR